MAEEIERKFLVVSDDWKALAESSSLLRQGYLSSNAKATVRVRTWDDRIAQADAQGRGAGHVAGGVRVRNSDVGCARRLLAMAEPHVLEKRRHLVPFGGLTWEIDVFEGRHAGLVIAEVELDSEDQQVELPDWVGNEVTDDDRYYNASLSRADGIPAVDPDAA